MEFIDLSHELDEESGWAPPWAACRVERSNHEEGARRIEEMFGVSREYLRSGTGWAVERLSISTHGTTHLDAPWHYAPTSEGRPARTIDQIPLSWCFGPGVVLDMRHKGDGEAITADDVKRDIDAAGLAIGPGTLVLVMTGNTHRFGTPEYFSHGSGMSAEATRYILDLGVHVTGIDSWGWDVPLAGQADRVRASGKKDLFWEGHFVGIDREYCHLERLTNLDKLPRQGFTVACFPLKVARGSAGPARVVAMI